MQTYGRTGTMDTKVDFRNLGKRLKCVAVYR
jgi:hypothetical protein